MTERGPVVFYFHSLIRNLAAGARLALFLPVRAFDYRVSPVHFAVLMAFDFAFWVAAAAVRAGFAGEFDPMAVPIFFAEVSLTLGAALLASLSYREPGRLLLIATALSASDAVYELAGLALPALAEASGHPAAALFLLLGWMWLVAVRAVAVCGGTQRPQFLLGAAAVSAMIAIGFFAFPRTDVWRAPQEEAGPEPLAEERLFHVQGQLIERALAGIR